MQDIAKDVLALTCRLLQHSATFHIFNQKFQRSSTPLLDLISICRLLTVDNVLSKTVYDVTRHRSWLPAELQLPSNISENDLLVALLQLFCWGSTFIITVEFLLKLFSN